MECWEAPEQEAGESTMRNRQNGVWRGPREGDLGVNRVLHGYIGLYEGYIEYREYVYVYIYILCEYRYIYIEYI